ncbi:MAG: type II secretion system major pseudopilin GspG [Victivallales bacterium]|nr:type II secretion system major pseudopilin GspG [Victivallales bacterium]MBO7533583.1 type II secretion system major pseudopilin GspG [Victivallales bacterium]MBO7618996.1 type II secretion system major pseudopilin GspG [Victivallales bacterium]
MKTMQRNRRQNFTLIEIMIVVVIIGMIAALAVPKLMGNLEKAKVETTKSNLATLKTAVRNFKMDVGDYPNRLEELLTTNGSEKWDGPYLDMKSLPKDGWDMDFVYTLTGDTFGFDIQSYGADKTSGGDGVNKDLSCWGEEQ